MSTIPATQDVRMTEDPNGRPYIIGSVTSRDGTTISYRQSGKGPGIVAVHGGAQ